MASKAVLELRPTNFAGLMDALKEVNRVMFSPERFLKVFSMDQQTLALRPLGRYRPRSRPREWRPRRAPPR